MAKLLTLKIVLRDVEPQVWRRVGVPGDFTLTDLHTVIQGVMGWHTTHLHCFEIGGMRYDTQDEDDFDWGMPRVDEKGVKLQTVLKKGQSFTYIYDFGDEWTHDLEVEAVENIREAGPGELSPRCVAGEGACPPEDCGGPMGYADLLEVLADPSHPEHADAVDWIGSFDASVFSVPQANSLVYALLALAEARRSAGASAF